MGPCRALFLCRRAAGNRGRAIRAAVGIYEAAIHALERQGDDADQTLKLDAYLELGTARSNPSNSKGTRSYWTERKHWPRR
jgi:hypothetical protein